MIINNPADSNVGDLSCPYPNTKFSVAHALLRSLKHCSAVQWRHQCAMREEKDTYLNTCSSSSRHIFLLLKNLLLTTMLFSVNYSMNLLL